MQLKQINDHVFYFPHEQRRDRPVLGYVLGDVFSVAIDAGASADHVNLFYDALSRANLPIPRYTAITHWHWDHTFGMHAVKGETIAHRNTVSKLLEMRESDDVFFYGDDRMRQEYSSPEGITIVLPDILFDDQYMLDLGGIHCQLTKIPSPHSNDATTILVPEHKVLFLGDAISPDYFNNSTYDADDLRKMTAWLEACDFETCLLGHSVPLTKAELMAYLYGL